jgi:hypothetical protein
LQEELQAAEGLLMAAAVVEEEADLYMEQLQFKELIT